MAGFLATWGPAIVGGLTSLASAQQHNDTLDDANEATLQASRDNIRMLTGMALQGQQEQAPYEQSGGSARNMMLASMGLGQMQKDLDAPNYLEQLFNENGGGGNVLSPEEQAIIEQKPEGTELDPNTPGSKAYRDELAEKGLYPSIAGKLSKELGGDYVEASLLNTIATGQFDTDNALKFGALFTGVNPLAGVGDFVGAQTGGTWYDPAGLFSSRKKFHDSPYAEELRGSDADFASLNVDNYLAANPHLQEYAETPLSNRDAGYIVHQGGDMNGDGKIDTAEKLWHHWIADGKKHGEVLALPEETPPQQTNNPSEELLNSTFHDPTTGITTAQSSGIISAPEYGSDTKNDNVLSGKTTPPWAEEGQYQSPSTYASKDENSDLAQSAGQSAQQDQAVIEMPAVENVLNGEVIDQDGKTILNPNGQYQTFSQDEAYDAFKNSGFYKSMIPSMNDLQQQLEGSAASRGKLLSGTHLNAVADNMQTHTSTAYNNFWNGLSSLSGTGAAIANSNANSNNVLGQSLANENGAAGNLSSQLALNKANPWGEAFAGAARGWANQQGYTA